MALSTSPSQTVSLWPPTPTPALMDSGAKMESLSNLGSGAVGRKETRRGQRSWWSSRRGKAAQGDREAAWGHARKQELCAQDTETSKSAPGSGQSLWAVCFILSPASKRALD